jgi:hypothetical protein
MSAPAFRNYFDIMPASKVTSPAPTHQKAPKNLREVGILPDVELDEITPGKSHNDSPKPGYHASGAQTPKTPNELEMSRPPTPRSDEAFGLMRTWNSPPETKWRILSCCLIYFANGMNDSGTYCTICLLNAILTHSSRRSFNPLHGITLPHFLHHHVSRLRRQRHWLHHRRSLHRHDSQ